MIYFEDFLCLREDGVFQFIRLWYWDRILTEVCFDRKVIEVGFDGTLTEVGFDKKVTEVGFKGTFTGVSVCNRTLTEGWLLIEKSQVSQNEHVTSTESDCN